MARRETIAIAAKARGGERGGYVERERRDSLALDGKG
jgi:hypothetical protein